MTTKYSYKMAGPLPSFARKSLGLVAGDADLIAHLAQGFWKA